MVWNAYLAMHVETQPRRAYLSAFFVAPWRRGCVPLKPGVISPLKKYGNKLKIINSNRDNFVTVQLFEILSGYIAL